MIDPQRRAAAVLVGLLFVMGCGGRAVIDGPPLDRPVVVDGSVADWQDRLQHVESAGLSVAATHDDRYLYLALATGDRALQGAILRRGLTLWLDGTGGDQRRLGLRYPTGLADAWGEPVHWPGRGEPASGGGPAGATPDDELARRERVAAQIAALPAEFLLIRDAEDSGRLVGLDERAAPGLALALGLEGSRLVYELRFPLQAAPGAMLPALDLAGDVVGVGLELVKAGGDGDRLHDAGGFGGMGGMPSPPNRMGGRSGGMSGPPPEVGARRDVPELDAWLQLRLTR